MLVTNPQCQPDPLHPNNPQGKNEPKSSETHTPSSPTKKYRGYWDRTGPNSASWPKYEGAPYPPGQREMSLKGKTCTLWCLKALSTRWQRPPGKWRTGMLSKKGSLKRPSMIFNGQGSPCNGLTPSDHSRKPHQAIKKIEERLTSTCHARMDSAVLPNGSNKWMEERWLDTPRTTRQGTSPSFPISTPQRRTTTTTTTTLLGPYQHGSYPPWEGVAPPLPQSIASLTNSQSTIGVSWLRSTGTM